MPPVRGQIAKRHKDKGPVLQPGMGQDQAVWRCLCLLRRRNMPPTVKAVPVGQHTILHRQQVQIQRALAPAGTPLATEPRLDLVQNHKHLIGAKITLNLNHRIHEIGTCPGGKTRGGKKSAYGSNRQSGPGQIVDRGNQDTRWPAKG